MAGKRLTIDDLKLLEKRKGYGIESAFGGGAFSGGSAFGKGSIGSAFKDTGKDEDLERITGDESLRAESVSLNYAGKVRVRIKFYRRRLADYSRAISEKAAIDVIVRSGALRDDSEKEIWLVDEGQEKVATEAEERMEVILEYSDVDFDNLFIPRTKFGNAGQK